MTGFSIFYHLEIFHNKYIFAAQISLPVPNSPREYSKSMCTLSYISSPPVPWYIYTQLEDEFYVLSLINYFLISTVSQTQISSDLWEHKSATQTETSICENSS